MTTFTVIHGPMRSGKTFHSAAFCRHYGCHASIDIEQLPGLSRSFQKDGLLILTNLSPDDAANRITKAAPLADFHLVDIASARSSIGVEPVYIPEPPKPIPEGWLPLSDMPIGDHRFITVEYLGPDGQSAEGYFTGQFYAQAPVRMVTHDPLPFQPVALRHMRRADQTPFPTADEMRFAEAMVNSDAALRVFSSTEWDELGDDGKAWITVVIREAMRIASHATAREAIDKRLSEITECPPEGFWRSCTGCHETFEGHSVGSYPWKAAMHCELGAGCSECGGIGAIWDSTDYADFAEFILAADQAEERLQSAIKSLIGEPHPNELRDDVSDDTFASIDTTAGHLRRLRAAMNEAFS